MAIPDQLNASRPNLLFVFADQMRGMDMACAGNPDIITPNMDRLAREGAFCSHCIATVPVCGPNRAILLTGTYSTTNGVITNDQQMLPGIPSLGTLARDNGYRTGYIGKWHLDGGPRDQFTPPGPRRSGFDDFWAAYNCSHDYFDTKYYRDTPELIRVEGYEPEIQTDLALEFLDAQQSEERPFCLVLSWGPPHNQYEEVPEKYRELYDPERLTLRPNIEHIDASDLDPAWSLRPTTADYYAAITALDEQLGRLLEKLEAMGQLDNTIVVFTSDHGDMLWSHGFLYKLMPHEESISVPLLVRWPEKIAAGSRCDTLIGTVDLLPTLAGLLSWELPASVEGSNLAPALTGEANAPEPTSAFIANYCHYVFRKDRPNPPWRGVRTPRYTYAETLDRKPTVLFDNDNDPYQLQNLAEVEEAQPLIEELKSELDGWLAKTRDPLLPGKEMQRLFSLEEPKFIY